jgi:hypothetical protein
MDVDHPPNITLAQSIVAVAPGAALPVAPLFTAIDPDGDAISQYRFTSYVTDAGHFEVGGVTQSNPFTVAAADVGQVAFVAESVPSNGSFGVEAYDGVVWGGGNAQSVLIANGVPPSVLASDATLAAGERVPATSLFSVSDPDGGTVQGYSFMDYNNDPASGHFEFFGQVRPANVELYVNPSFLSEVYYVAGTNGTVDRVAVRVGAALTPNLSSRDLESAWAEFSIASGSAPGDAAGNNLASARPVSVTATPSTFHDFVGDADPEDFYKFTLGSPSEVLVGLTGLSGNADLTLLNSAGGVIASSQRPERSGEAISIPVSAGTYYVRVLPVSGTDTSYSLALAAV